MMSNAYFGTRSIKSDLYELYEPCAVDYLLGYERQQFRAIAQQIFKFKI